jgi:hypothetical protein
LNFKAGASHPVYTAVLGFENARALKGNGSSALYVEAIRGGVSASQLRKVAPRQMRMLLLLRPPSWPASTYQFSNDGAGVPPGEVLRAFVYPAGLMVESAGGVEYPFADNPKAPFFVGKTLQEVEQEIASLVRSFPP